jgi:hypothetical protein
LHQRRHQSRTAKGQGVEPVELFGRVVAREHVDRLAGRRKIVEGDQRRRSVASGPAQFDAIERIAIRATRAKAPPHRRSRRHACSAAQVGVQNVEIEIARERQPLDLQAIDGTADDAFAGDPQSTFDREAAVRGRGRRRAAELETLTAALDGTVSTLHEVR